MLSDFWNMKLHRIWLVLMTIKDSNKRYFPFQIGFIKVLSEILKHGGNGPVARMQAGIQLKNALFSKDRDIRLEQHKRWLSFPEPDRIVIKQNVGVTFVNFVLCLQSLVICSGLGNTWHRNQSPQHCSTMCGIYCLR